MRFDLSGRVSLDVSGDSALQAYVRRQLQPFAPVGNAVASASLSIAPLEGAADVAELQGPAEDGLTTGRLATAGRGFVTWDGRRCTVPNVLEGEATFGYEPGFPLWRVLRPAVRPALQIAPAVAGTAVAIHAASVTVDDGAIAVAGWAESGKTEVALALMERGASFLSDKWTFVGRSDLEASLFPISIGVRRWVLDYLPTLRAATTVRSRAQFAVARGAGIVLGPLARRRGRSRAGAIVPGLAQLASSLGDRAAYSIEDLRRAYGQQDDPLRRRRLRLLVLLRTIADDAVSVSDIGAADASRRLARTAAYERRGYAGLLDRLSYVDPAAAGSATDAMIRADEGVLSDICSAVPTVVVDAPFPSDPGRVADAILQRL